MATVGMKGLIFVDIQHRYSSILLALREAGFVCNNWLSNFLLRISFLTQYEYTEFYVTMKTLTRTDVLRGH